MSRASSAKQWASDIVDDVTNKLQLVPRSNLEQAKSGLDDIAIRTAELSGKLWTQKQRWTIWRWQDLKPIGAEYQELMYQSGAPNMQPHAFHNAELSEDGDALNGRAAVLLFQPAVVTWGNADGGDYESKKIWRKAVVWLRSSNDGCI